VKNNEIVLNVGFEATTALKLGNEYIEFKARFGGMAREIVVPVDHVVAIYARENGQGMAFPVPTAAGAAAEGTPAGESQPAAGAPIRGLRLASTEAESAAPPGAVSRVPPDEPPEPTSPRPSLKRVK
jgi:stringent starvation protein B